MSQNQRTIKPPPSEGVGGRPGGVYDLIAIGLGPFNLGLAALCENIPDFNTLFIDQNESFNWHPGMMIKGTRLQVPFYADLVTLADPTSPYSYMAFLKARKKMFRFAIEERFNIRRAQYNEYCRWVADQLGSIRFNTTCTKLSRQKGMYQVETGSGTLLAKNIVLGIGTVPMIPSFVNSEDENIFHSSKYMHNKEQIKAAESISIIGSGQSAAEIFSDLLDSHSGKLSWFTRSDRLFPMDTSKFALEMATPEYIDYFYNLPPDIKPRVLQSQNNLYKGINQDLIAGIYDQLSLLDYDNATIHPNCELRRIGPEHEMQFMELQQRKTFQHRSEVIILATGYEYRQPSFIDRSIHLLPAPARNYSIDQYGTLFIQNAEINSHGFNAADLSLGPYRNAVILNTILQREHFSIETGNNFQRFGVPKT